MCHNYEGKTLYNKNIYILKMYFIKHNEARTGWNYLLTHKQLLSSAIHLEQAAASPQGRAVRSLSVQITHTLIKLCKYQ